MIRTMQVRTGPRQNVPRDIPGPPAVSLASEESRVINALDALLSRAWR